MKAACLLVLCVCLSTSSHAQSSWHICQPYEKRHTCVVDGDTLWVNGEKMRLKGVDTPEMDARCAREQQLAQQATDLHLALISSGIRSITRHGQDAYGRTLVEIDTHAGAVGPTLLSRGLADLFGDGRRTNWCR